MGEQWKEFLLNHTALSKIDSSLKKASPVLFVLFGEDYDFSYRFLLVVLFWIAFFLTFEEIFLYFSTYDKKYSYIFGLILAVICAHLRLIKGFTELFYKVMFGLFGGIFLPSYFSSGIGSWLWEIIILTVIFSYLIFSGQLVRLAKKAWDKWKEKRRLKKLESQGEYNKEVIEKIGKGFGE